MTKEDKLKRMITDIPNPSSTEMGEVARSILKKNDTPDEIKRLTCLTVARDIVPKLEK